MFKGMVARRGMSLGTALVLGLVGWANVCAAQEHRGAKPQDPQTTQEPKAQEPKLKDIIDTSQKAGFKTFNKLVESAELVEFFKGKDVYTVLIPTDEAFNKLGKETLDDWMKPENKAKLAKILKNHVLTGAQNASAIQGLKTVKSLAENELTVEYKDGIVTIGTAKITKTDLKASNGLIHAIDGVLMPKD